MTRTTAREIAIQIGFAASATGEKLTDMMERFLEKEHYESLAQENPLYEQYPDDAQLEYIRRLTGLIDEHRDEIDEQIRQHARGWKLHRISRTALAVLRCAMCEILYMEDVPASAAINEAVEIAKGYDSPDTVSFINGVLGGFMRTGRES